MSTDLDKAKEVPPAWVMRRAEFVCAEARLKDREHDQTILYALRVLSNWVTVGIDGNSREVKRRNRRVSGNALRELQELLQIHSPKETFKIWHKNTTNEHRDPLQQVWQWLCNETPTANVLLDRLASDKFITITNEENKQTAQNGHRWKGDRQARHQHIDPREMPEEVFNAIQIKRRRIKSHNS